MHAADGGKSQSVVLAAQGGASAFLVDCCDGGQRDAGGADISALTEQGAGAEAGLDLVDHLAGTLAALFLAQGHEGEVDELRAGEQVRSTVRAGGDTSATADAGCVVECKLSGLVVHVQGVSIRCGTGVDGDVATLLHDAVQCGAVDDHVLNHRVRCGAQRFELDGVAVVEVEQALLAGRLVLLGTVGATVDVEATGTTDAFAAVRGECERLFAGLNEAFVDVVKQLQDRHLLDSVVDVDGFEAALGVRSGLTPNFKMEFHYL